MTDSTASSSFSLFQICTTTTTTSVGFPLTNYKTGDMPVREELQASAEKVLMFQQTTLCFDSSGEVSNQWPSIERLIAV